MAIHTLHAAYVPGAATVPTADTDVSLTPTADGLLAVQGTQAIVSRPLRLAAGWAAANSLYPDAVGSFVDARVESPAFADINPASLRPIDLLAAGVVASPLAVTDLACEPLPLRAGDPVAIIGTIAAGTSFTPEMHALLWFSDGCDPLPRAPSFYVHFEVVTVPSTKGAWTSTAIRFRRQLPGRRFAILGADYAQAGAFAARFMLPDSPLRPGIPASQSVATPRARIFDAMHLGVLGTFDGYAPPTLEVYIPSSATAGTVARGWMRLAPIDAAKPARGGCGCGGGCGGSCGGGR